MAQAEGCSRDLVPVLLLLYRFLMAPGSPGVLLLLMMQSWQAAG